MLTSYHWIRISDEHVLVIGGILAQYYYKMQDNPHVSVLPTTNSGKTVASYLQSKNKQGHIDSLRELGLEDSFTMIDFLEYLEDSQKAGPAFLPDL
jgi:hypothetical protein